MMIRTPPLLRSFFRFNVLASVVAVGALYGGIPAARVDVTPSGASFDEHPKARIAGETPGAGFFASDNNRGDWAIGLGATPKQPTGRPLPQEKGVLMASLAELLPQTKRGGVEVCGKLTAGFPSSVVPGSVWVAGFTAAGNGAEANVDFAVAWFPFEDGWIGGHVDRQSRLLAGNVPAGTVIRKYASGSFAGEIRLQMPGATPLDGMLFTIAGENGDNVTAVGPMPDGSGWHIRVADESHDFRREEAGPWSFVFVPYDLEGLIGGFVQANGEIRRGAGEFAVVHTAPGRYEVFIPERTGSDGVLLLEVCRMNDKGVEDNAIAWAYDPNACGGRGGFVVETYDQPAFNNQDVSFYLLFVPFDNVLDPKRRVPGPEVLQKAGRWSEAMVGALGYGKGQTFPWESAVLKPGQPPASVSLSVTGLRRLWLIADEVDGRNGASAFWGDPRFVLKDGAVRYLSDLPLVFDAVGRGKPERRSVTAGNETFDHALVAPARSLLAINVPAGAVAFKTAAGVEESGNSKAGVRFRITDRPSRRGWWTDAAWPAMRRRWPDICTRFTRDVGDVSMRPPDLDALVPKLEQGLQSMRSETDFLAARAPRLPTPRSTRGVLETYERMVVFLGAARKAVDRLWSAAPVLAELLNYPKPDTGNLRAALTRLRESQPDLTTSIRARIQTLDRCDSAVQRMLLACLDGRENPFADVSDVAQTLADISEWTDQHLGWTTYGGNPHRSFVAHEPIDPEKLAVLWRHRPAAPPAPAWPPPASVNYDVAHRLSPAVTYDRAFHVVAARGRVVYASSSSDAVVCLNAADGRELWRFPVEGPVRLSPTLAYGRVYAGSDDGALYCIDLESGRLLWRCRPDSSDARLVGNDRIISERPVRCGISVGGGMVYFCAGLFPHLGIHLYAVDARTGKVVKKTPLRYSPQGYMLLTPKRIFIPTGRTPFVVLRRSDFSPVGTLGRSDSWGRNLPGGSCAVVVSESIITGPGEGGAFHAFDPDSTETIVKTPGRRIIVDGLVTYVLRTNQLLAISRREYLEGRRPRTLWETPCPPAYSMLKTPRHLVVGADGLLLFFRAEDGKEVRRIRLRGGRIEGLALNAGRLFVSSADGSTYCLAVPQGAPPETVRLVGIGSDKPRLRARARALAEPAKQDADALIAWCGFRTGRALVVGDAETAPPAAALALESSLRVTLAVQDPAAAETLRRRFAQCGLLGVRVSVHSLIGPELPYRPYTFNLVIVTKKAGVDPRAAFRVLRPLGGCLAAASPPGEKGFSRPPGKLDKPPVARLPFGFRRDRLPGTGSWTHAYADPEGTVCSGDAMPYGTFRLLWFGRPGPRRMFDRHWKAVPPLYCNGILYTIGRDWLAGVDAYNGTIRWERTIPGAGRVALLRDCGNMAVADDNRLYVAADADCIVLDGSSGEEVARQNVTRCTPHGEHWGFVTLAGDILVGTGTRAQAEFSMKRKEDYAAIWHNNQPVATSLSVFGADRRSLDPLWRYQPPDGVIVNPSLTVLGDRVCFIESGDPGTKQHPTGRIPIPELWQGGTPHVTALDARSGKLLWRVPIELASTFVNAVYMQGAGDFLVLTGTRVAEVKGRSLIQYRLIGLDANTGEVLWQNDNTPSQAEKIRGGHGEQTQHPAIVRGVVYGPGFARWLKTGEPYTGWIWKKSPQCAPLSASLNCAFSRQGGHPTVADFKTGKSRPLTYVTRPGCYLNILPAGGIVLIPEASSGCTCGYSIQASLAFYLAKQGPDQ